MCVGTKSTVDVRRVVGFGTLRWESKPPISFPLKVVESPSHLLNRQLYFLLVLFHSCLGFCPLDALKMLTDHIGFGAVDGPKDQSREW